MAKLRVKGFGTYRHTHRLDEHTQIDGFKTSEYIDIISSTGADIHVHTHVHTQTKTCDYAHTHAMNVSCL